MLYAEIRREDLFWNTFNTRGTVKPIAEDQKKYYLT